MKSKTVITSLIVSIFLFSSTVSNAATLHIRPSGSLKKMDYLCIYDLGCFNLQQASSGMTFKTEKIDFTQLKRIALLNAVSNKISSTAIDSSCSNLTADKNQTVTVNVHIEKYQHSDDSVVKTVSCKVSG